MRKKTLEVRWRGKVDKDGDIKIPQIKLHHLIPPDRTEQDISYHLLETSQDFDGRIRNMFRYHYGYLGNYIKAEDPPEGITITRIGNGFMADVVVKLGEVRKNKYTYTGFDPVEPVNY